MRGTVVPAPPIDRRLLDCIHLPLAPPRGAAQSYAHRYLVVSGIRADGVCERNERGGVNLACFIRRAFALNLYLKFAGVR